MYTFILVDIPNYRIVDLTVPGTGTLGHRTGQSRVGRQQSQLVSRLDSGLGSSLNSPPPTPHVQRVISFMTRCRLMTSHMSSNWIQPVISLFLILT